MNFFFQFLHSLLHLLADLLLWFAQFQPQEKFFTSSSSENNDSRLFMEKQNSCQRDNKEFQLLYSAILGEFSKLPNHIAVVVDELDTANDGMIIKLCCWCIPFGIRYLTIFESSGRLKEQTQEFGKDVEAMMKRFFGEDVNFQIWIGKENFQPILLKYHLSTTQTVPLPASLPLFIDVISQEDGKRELISVSRKICEEVEKGILSPNNISCQIIDTKIREIRGFPDPELLLKFDATQVSSGYPPWQLRLTEIHEMGRLSEVKCEDFIRSMRQFAKCQQRFGR